MGDESYSSFFLLIFMIENIYIFLKVLEIRTNVAHKELASFN